MKQIKLAALVLVTLLLTAGTALALDSANLLIQANVLGTCSFSAPSTTLDFLDIDPTSGLDETATTSIDYTCTNGTAYTLTTPASGTISNGTDSITVNLAYTDAGGGTGTGAATTLTIDGTIPFANYSGVSAGLYTGTVVLDVSP